MSTLSIIGTKVRTDAEGRYSLNDLHKAAVKAGANKRTKEPNKFLSSLYIKDFIKTVSDTYGKSITVSSSKSGRDQGTYAVKEIALKYASWVGGGKFEAEVYSSILNIQSLISALDNFEIPNDIDDMYIYMIKESDTGNVKIGISRDPERRLKQLQTGNSSKLELVACKKACNGYEDEQNAHLINSSAHIHGEWFSSQAEI